MNTKFEFDNCTADKMREKTELNKYKHSRIYKILKKIDAAASEGNAHLLYELPTRGYTESHEEVVAILAEKKFKVDIRPSLCRGFSLLYITW